MEQLKFENEISIPQAKALFPRGMYINDDVFLLDNVIGSNLPRYKKVAKCIVIIICEEGRIRFETKGKTVFAEKNDVILLTMGQSVNHYKVLSSSYKGKAILVAPQKLPMLAELFCDTNSLSQKLNKNDKIKLSEEEMYNSQKNFYQIQTFINSEFHNKKLAFAMTLIKLILQTVLAKTVDPYLNMDRDDRNFYNFVQLVDENLLQNLTIKEYCQQLNISRTTLETIVRKHLIDYTPTKYLHLRLTYHICIMARNTSRKVLPTSAIAKRFHFPNTTALARFVKREINMSLTTFRNLTPDAQLDIIHHTIPDQILLLEASPRTYKQEGSIPPLS